MKTRRLVAALGVLALAGPSFADIADGLGGRTSLQASRRPAIAAGHSCCPRTTLAVTATRPASPAERKAIGEIAWDSRHLTAVAEKVPCYKMTAGGPTHYASSAELKAIGHVNRGASATRRAAAGCCDSVSCPMRKTS